MPISSSTTGGVPATAPTIVDCTGSVGTLGQFLSSTGSSIRWILGCQGTVTSVATGTGLTGGPVTTSGTIALANTAVIAGAYTFGSFTVDAQGRLTAATSCVPVTSVTAGTGLTGGTITSTGTIALANTAVTPGAYTYGSFTVDAQGRLTAAASGTAPVTAITGTAPIGVTTGTTPVVSISAASTTACGAVQLYDNTNSTSTTLALTAAQGKNLQDQINALGVTSNLTLAGTFDATTGLMLSVTAAGTVAGFAVGSNLIAAAAGNVDFFVIVTTGGTYSPPGGGGPYTASQGDWFLSTGTAWSFLNVGPTPAYATTTSCGVVCLSTNALAQAGTDALTALTPAAGASVYVFKSCYAAKGTILGGSAASTPTALAVGTDGQTLSACAACPTGLTWTTPAAAIPCACVTSKGALVTGTAAGTPVGLAVGTNGQVLSANSACTSGLTWITPTSGTVTSVATGTGLTGGPITATGTVSLANTAVTPGSYTYANITVDAQGRLTAASSGTAPTGGTVTSVAAGSGLAGGTITTTGTLSLNFACVIAPSLLTTKGSIITASAPSTPIVLAAGSNGQYLTACSTCAVGLAWTSGPGGTVTSVTAGTGLSGGTITTTGTVALTNTAVTPGSYTYSSFTVDAQGRLTAASSGATPICKSEVLAKGNLIVGTAAGAICALGVGPDTQVLTACSACPSGVTWAPSAPVSNATPTVTGLLYGTQNLACSNNAVGHCALNTSLCAGSTGLGNVAVGACALRLNTTGLHNVAIGTTSLAANVSGGANVAMGTNSLRYNTNGGLNTSIGHQSSVCNVTGGSNAVLGSFSLRYNTSGSNNTGLGVYALYYNSIGSSNTAVGYCAIQRSTGNNNVAVGACAGSGLTAGCSNVIIGPNAQPTFASGNCQLSIGFSPTDNWLTGCSDKSIRPGAGIRDCVGVTGTAGQVLMSNGANAVCWGSPAGTPVATPTIFGIVLGCTTANNASLGCNALLSNTTGCHNTAIGKQALSSNLTSSYNTAVGACVLPNHYGCQATTAVGGCSMFNTTTGGSSTAVGFSSLYRNTIGQHNTAIGSASLVANLSGCNNTALGDTAGCNLESGNNNVAIGYSTAFADPFGSCQLVIGFNTNLNWLTGNGTKAIKPGAGIIDCANSCGTAGQVLMSNGANAICWGNASGSATLATPTVAGTVFGCMESIGLLTPGNTSVGYCALQSNNNSGSSLIGGIFNTAVGFKSMGLNTCGSNNASLGYCSLGNNTTGDNNTAIGYMAQRSNTTGHDNTAVGEFSLINNVSGAFNVAIGSNSLICSVTACSSTAVGHRTLYSAVCGEHTAVGCGALEHVTTGSANTAVGTGSGNSVTVGSRNVSVGYLSMYCASGTYLDFNTAVGNESLFRGSGGFSTAIGSCSLNSATTGDQNTAVGMSALYSLTTGRCNVGLGAFAGMNLTTGDYNVIIGSNVSAPVANGGCQLVIGFGPTSNWITGNGTKAIKPGAGIIDCANSCGTAGQVLMSNGANAICWGTATGFGPATPTVAGSVYGCNSTTNTALGQYVGTLGFGATSANNVIVGYCTAYASTTLGCNNTVFGACGPVGLSTANNNYNTLIGFGVGRSLGGAASANVGIGSNTLGTNGLYNIAIGSCVLTQAQNAAMCDNIGIGRMSLASFGEAIGCTCAWGNIAIGSSALVNLSYGQNNIAIGMGCACNGTSITLASLVNDNNRILLGNSCHTCAQIKVAWTVTSDVRDKALDFEGVPHGLHFVENLHPIAYRFCDRNTQEVTDSKLRYGFSAQEIADLEGDKSVIVSTDDPEKYQLTDAHLVPVLVNAIKELSAEVKSLKAEVAALKGS